MRYATYFKFSREMLEDTEALYSIIYYRIQKGIGYNKGIVYKLLHVMSGDESDDFVRELKTCVITYYTFKAPRFLFPQKRRIITKFKFHKTK